MVVNVKNPVYDKRRTINHIRRTVCTDVFDKKYYYRKLLGALTVHATDDEKEATKQLKLLFKKTPKAFKKEHKKKWDKTIKKHNLDLI